MAAIRRGAAGRAAAGFGAGAVSVLVFHQGMWAILHGLHLMPPPFPVAPVPPFGIPSIYDLCFWGGLYGLVFGLLAPVLPGRQVRLQGIVLGLIAECGALFLVPAIRGWPMAFGGSVRTIAVSALINGTWGLGVGLLIPLVLAFGRAGRRGG